VGDRKKIFHLRPDITLLVKDELLDAELVNWEGLGNRLQQYRESVGYSQIDFADKAGIGRETIVFLEEGRAQRVQTPQFIFGLCETFQISKHWLFNGIGTPSQVDPAWFLPDTVLQQRGAGIRRSDDMSENDEGGFTDDKLEFVKAIDRFRMMNKGGLPPRLSEVFDIVIALGYRKTTSPTIGI